MQRTVFDHDLFTLFARELSDSHIRQLHQTCLEGKAAGNKYLALMVHNPELLITYLSRMNAEKLRKFIGHRFNPATKLYAALAEKYQADPTNQYTAACYALIGPANQIHFRILVDAHSTLLQQGIDEHCCFMQSLEFQAQLASYNRTAVQIQTLIREMPNALHNLRGIELEATAEPHRKKHRT